MSDRRWVAQYRIALWSDEKLSENTTSQIREHLSEFGLGDARVTIEAPTEIQIVLTVDALTHLDAVASTNDFVVTSVRAACAGEIVAMQIGRHRTSAGPPR